MHIVLAVLGSVVTILILLNRLAEAGIDLGGLNPFLWARRRRWKKKYEGNPLWQIEQPLDATAILMVAIAKADGDMAREQKSELLEVFEREFKLSRKDAAGLLISSVHLLGDGETLRKNVKKFLSPNAERFTAEQSTSAVALLERIAGPADSRHPNAQQLVTAATQVLGPREEADSTW